MKKAFVIIGALLMLAACSKNAVTDQPVIPDNPTEDTAEFKVSLTISRSDAFGSEPETRATVKREWADGDVVFVFFQGVAAPKYLEMTYSSATQEFTATPRNDLSVSDLGSSGTMTAVYLPYGSSSTVSADDKGNFKFDPLYEGFYLQAEQVEYACREGVLKGTLTLAAPQLDEGGKYIHFDASGYDASHAYTLYQDYVSSVTFIGVASNGIVPIYIGTPGGAIPGYVDADRNILSFSGVLDASAVGKAVDYQFSINDAAASVLYTRDAGTKTLTSSKYIGIGNLSSAPWNAMGYVDIGVKVDGKPLYWATQNLGATAETGEGSWGNYYAWGETTGYPVTGTFPNYSSNHNFSTVPTYECYGDAYPVSNPKYFYYLPQYDPAHAVLGGLWRTPSPQDFQKLKDVTEKHYDIGALEHDYVDMGDGLGWATMNVGGSAENPRGNEISWGGDGQDPASEAWGPQWRTPTQSEWQWLVNSENSTWEKGYSDEYNTLGFWITSKKTGNILFFPIRSSWSPAYYLTSDIQKRETSSNWWDAWITNFSYDDNDVSVNYCSFGGDLPSGYLRPVVDLGSGSANAGVTFTGKNAGYTDKSLYLPAAGRIDGTTPEKQGVTAYYWTCERYPAEPAIPNAMRVTITNDPGWSGFNTGESEWMRCGLPVRPVFTLDDAQSIPGGLNAPSDYHDGGDPLEF